MTKGCHIFFQKHFQRHNFLFLSYKEYHILFKSSKFYKNSYIFVDVISWLNGSIYFLIKIYYNLFSRITLCSSYTFRNFPNCFLVLSSSGSWPRSWMSRYLLYPLDNKSIIHWKVILLKNGAFVCLYTVLPRVSRSIKYLLLLLV